MLLISVRMKHLKMAVFAVLVMALAAFLVLAVMASHSESSGHFLTAAERIEFLKGCGIEAVGEASDSVIIPTRWSGSFTEYNELQQKQGYDLRKYKGRVAERYTYAERGGGAVVTLLIYEGRVIGYDVFDGEVSPPAR